jgi:hypothetical protein
MTMPTVPTICSGTFSTSCGRSRSLKISNIKGFTGSDVRKIFNVCITLA